MPTTARFELQRQKQLKVAFTQKRLVQLWRDLVRQQLRGLDITDLHDYYDFNFSIERRVDEIIDRVLSGQYRADPPLIYTVEKKHGVCRHLMIPTPSDALVFQLLTDLLYGAVIEQQPSKKAYYARDRHVLSLPHDIKESNGYPWFVLWPRFQTQIWDFSKSFKFLVTTDLTNYFDSIGLRELRHVISSLIRSDEVFLDLLFSLIEDLSWSPDYLPRSNKGLPTINIEAPRLLSHAFLFEIDTVLKERTHDSFVRWMDDINFGVDDRKDASRILGQLNDVLKSRGLALNLSKTTILSSKQAGEHFLFKENVRLNKCHARAKKLKRDGSKRTYAQQLAKQFKKHYSQSKAKNRDKVIKRYLSILGTLGQPVAFGTAFRVFQNEPGLRPAVLRYLARVRFTPKTADTFLQLVSKVEIFDDLTLYKFVEALIHSAIPVNAWAKKFLEKVRKQIGSPDTPMKWVSLVNFSAKYGAAHEAFNLAQEAKKHGAKSPFFMRQAMVLLARGLALKPQLVVNQWRHEVSTGGGDSASVANNMLSFYGSPFPTSKSRAYKYLFPDVVQSPYPLAKFLLLCAIAAGETDRKSFGSHPEIKKHITDAWYLARLHELNPAWA